MSEVPLYLSLSLARFFAPGETPTTLDQSNDFPSALEPLASSLEPLALNLPGSATGTVHNLVLQPAVARGALSLSHTHSLSHTLTPPHTPTLLLPVHQIGLSLTRTLSLSCARSLLPPVHQIGLFLSLVLSLSPPFALSPPLHQIGADCAGNVRQPLSLSVSHTLSFSLTLSLCSFSLTLTLSPTLSLFHSPLPPTSSSSR